jgi:hypothetical protein
MKNEKEILTNFQVEELEKRFEMCWIHIGGTCNCGDEGNPTPPPPTPPSRFNGDI